MHDLQQNIGALVVVDCIRVSSHSGNTRGSVKAAAASSELHPVSRFESETSPLVPARRQVIADPLFHFYSLQSIRYYQANKQVTISRVHMIQICVAWLSIGTTFLVVNPT